MVVNIYVHCITFALGLCEKKDGSKYMWDRKRKRRKKEKEEFSKVKCQQTQIKGARSSMKDTKIDLEKIPNGECIWVQMYELHWEPENNSKLYDYVIFPLVLLFNSYDVSKLWS